MSIKKKPSRGDEAILIEHYQAGRYDLAYSLAKLMVENNSRYSFGWKVLGSVLKKIGKIKEALIANKKLVEISPDDADAYFNLANTQYELGILSEAEENYKKAIFIKPNLAAAYYHIGNIFHKQNKLSEAVLFYKKAIQINLEYTDAYYNLGVTLYLLGYIDEAVSSYRKVISINPNHIETYNNLGVIMYENNKFEEAISLYKNALVINFENAEAHCNLGNANKKLGNIKDAEINYKKAILIKPDYAEAYFNLGVSLIELDNKNDALECFQKAIEIKPDYAEAYSTIAGIFHGFNRLDEAVKYYKLAISIKPNYTDAYFNFGILLNDSNKLNDAIECYRKAIAFKPDFAKAHSNLGLVYKRAGRYIDALLSINDALLIDPDDVFSNNNYSLLLAYTSNYKEVIKFSDNAICHPQLDPLKKSVIWETRLYTWIYHPDLSAEEICEEHIKWGDEYAHINKKDFFSSHDFNSDRRIRIGYVSPDFRGHTCRFYFEPLFSSHDHNRFKVFAYSNVLLEDEHTKRMKPYFDNWRNILNLSDEEAAELIHNDKIDILIDGCGHMTRTRLGIFAHKPAPIQVTWLGSAWTTGLPQMDYVLFDPYMAPKGTIASEKIIHLPKTWVAFRPGDRAIVCEVKKLPALKNGYITFGYTGRTERLNYRVFLVWGRILKRLPKARLIIDYKPFNDSITREYYLEFLDKHGVDSNRVLLRNSSNIYEGLGDIDILLDSFPHSGGTMLFDALWMGVPAVTLASNRPVGRIGTSLMTNLGLEDWVAKDEQEYEDKAVAFALEFPSLENLRSGMRVRMQRSPVMDEKGFAQDVEAAFINMWHIWLDSLVID